MDPNGVGGGDKSESDAKDDVMGDVNVNERIVGGLQGSTKSEIQIHNKCILFDTLVMLRNLLLGQWLQWQLRMVPDITQHHLMRKDVRGCLQCQVLLPLIPIAVSQYLMAVSHEMLTVHMLYMLST